MLVELGPYPSGAARAWVANARRLIDLVVSKRDKLPFNLPAEIVDEFLWYLDEWDTAAQKGKEFLWSGDVDAGEMRTLLTYWLNLARISNDSDDLPTSPQPARHFYPAVIGDILETLGEESGHGTFCRRARAAWPGLSDNVECDRT